MTKQEPTTTIWSKSEKESLEFLETSRKGLSNKEAQKRILQFGANTIEHIHRSSVWQTLIAQFVSPLIFILIFAGIITLVLSDWVDALFIFLAVGVNAGLGFYQENKAEQALEHLKSYLEERARVLRNGAWHEIDTREIVPGDIVQLSLGARVPADVRILEGRDVLADEAVLTGEALPVNKGVGVLNAATSITERTNMLYGGTLVVHGSCVGVVYATGIATEFGAIAKMVATSSREETPLQQSVRHLAWTLARVLLGIIAVIFVVGILQGRPLFEMFLIGVAMAVGAIPEGMPIAMTVILAIGVERLAKRNGVVKKLVAAEALGSATIILTDKTGTLTQAKMSLDDVVPLYELERGATSSSTRKATFSQKQKQVVSAALCNSDVMIENPQDSWKKWRLGGRPLETSLVREASKRGMEITNVVRPLHIEQLSPFNSADKYSIARVSGTSIPFVSGGGASGSYLSFFGAPEILLAKSRMKKSDYLAARKAIDELAADGERVLGVAYRKETSSDKASRHQFGPLTFLGVIRFNDPLRVGVKKAVKSVQDAGVRVVIVTGDHEGTATAVAKSLGFSMNEASLMNGEQLRELSDKELLGQLDDIHVFARVSPQDKVRILTMFQKKGETVAMTGDGVNDAPSLKKADIGVAVGDGTDVSKDVADLVLLDNRFHTIVSAIHEGRRIMSNIRKAVVYLISDMLNEVFLIGGSLLAGLALPIGALQILWVNFFSDSFPAIAFAFEKQNDGQTRATKKGRILNREAGMLVAGVGTITSAILFVLYWGLERLGVEHEIVRTFIFTSFGIYTLMVAFSLRRLDKNIWEYKVFTNNYLNAGVLLGIIMMLAAIYVPFLQNIFDVVALPVVWWGAVVAFCVVSIGMVEVVKWFYARHPAIKARRK